jgi:molybdopterin-containing oxidoreductase family membrane subunit
VIIVPTLCRTYLPSTWGTYTPSFIDVGIFVGTIGMFGTFFLLFSRYFPVIAQAELKTILKSSGEAQKKESAHSHH